MENFNEVRNLRLDNPVVVRKVPMTAHGCNMLRAIREYQLSHLRTQEGLEVELPFPSVFHLMMVDYCNTKGIVVEE